MAAFRPFEIQAIRLIVEGVVDERVLSAVLSAKVADHYDYTGSGYYVTLRHPDLPEGRRSLSDPPVRGICGEIQAGFVVFLGDHELVLECHMWGPVDVPADFRDMEVVVSKT